MSVKVRAEPVLGGFFICRPQPVQFKFYNQVHGFRLMSDLHIGAANADYKKIRSELNDALAKKDRVLINGDVFDFILPKDHKRYTPDAVHPRISNRNDPVNPSIEWGVELLSPVAHLIDMIGVGNHETMLTKWHGMDPTLLLLYELEKVAKKKDPDHVIHYGGYTGFIDYRFRQFGKAHHGSNRWIIYYHHGTGGSAPVTKGMIDFNRKDTFVDADLIWMGHKHNRLMDTAQKLRCPMEGDSLDVRDVKHVMTGAYFDTYVGQSQESVRENGRRSNYAADGGLAPQGKGGARVTVTVRSTNRNGQMMDVEVTQ